jgi:hypothetical protein
MSRDFHICHPPVSRRTRSDVQRAPLQPLLDPHRNSALRSPKRRLWRLAVTSITSSRARAEMQRIRRSCRRVACTPCTMHPVERHAVDTRRIAARASARSGFLTYVRRRCQMPVMPGESFMGSPLCCATGMSSAFTLNVTTSAEVFARRKYAAAARPSQS